MFYYYFAFFRRKQDSSDMPLQMVRLDWVSSEDGAYILTVGVGPKIFLFAPVAEDVAQKNVAMMHESETHHQKRPLLRKASTIATPVVKKLLKWINFRFFYLNFLFCYFVCYFIFCFF